MAKLQSEYSLDTSAHLRDAPLSNQSFPGSHKIYVEGDGRSHNVKVGMREIELSPTIHANGRVEFNAKLRVYDTSGPYTDPKQIMDVYAGLQPLRSRLHGTCRWYRRQRI